MVAAPLVFRDASATRAITGGDWDYGRGKATCDDGEGIMGISLHLGDRQGHAALCRGNAKQLTGAVVTGLFLPAISGARSAWATGRPGTTSSSAAWASSSAA